MLWIIKRALGPAVAIHLPGAIAFLSERSQHQFATTLISRQLQHLALLPNNYFKRASFLLAHHQKRLHANTTMSLATLYDSMVTLPLKQLKPLQDNEFYAISTTTASYEEAVLLEEPTSSSSSSSTASSSDDLSHPSLLQSTTTTTKKPENLLWNSIPEPVEVQGVTLSNTKHISLSSTTNIPDEDGASSSPSTMIALYRNGYGVRTVRAPFGITIHVYVATLYTREPIRTAQDVDTLLLDCDNNGDDDDTDTDSNSSKEAGPFVMEFTFLRAVTPSQMWIAWNYQLDTSVMTEAYSYDQYADDRARFLEMLDGSMEEKGTIVFEFRGGDGMTVINQGQRVGEISGPHFQKAFCSMWFGDKPVMEEIKEGLLQGDRGDSKGEEDTAVDPTVISPEGLVAPVKL